MNNTLLRVPNRTARLVSEFVVHLHGFCVEVHSVPTFLSPVALVRAAKFPNTLVLTSQERRRFTCETFVLDCSLTGETIMRPIAFTTFRKFRRSAVVWSSLSLLALNSAVTIAQSSTQPKTNKPNQPVQPTPRNQPNPPQPPPSTSQFGLPLAGLSAIDIAAFNAGKEEFTEVATKQSGLGPIFNNNSCAACHSVPALGGSSNIFITRFGHASGTSFDPLTSLGGSLLQDKAIDPTALERVPTQANVTAHRQTTPLFGLGLIEAIPDATIVAGVRTKPVDGIVGKAALIVDPASGKTMVGKFGWKAQHATLLSFSADAYANEMGITNRIFPTENAPNGNAALLKKLDTVADPEDKPDIPNGKAGIDLLADFMRLMSAPPTKSVSASNAFGAKIFLDVGCANCHTPMMTTGTSSIPALSKKSVMLYSDLLLHDMGPLGDGIAQGAAGVREMKTPPLWGVGVSGPYLHDGRARDLDSAIRAHDGEAKTTTARYNKLSHDQQQLLIEFLNSI